MKYKYIINIMQPILVDNNKLKIILEKYKNELIDYYLVNNDNIESLPLNCFIKYISKKNYIKKGGFLKEVKINDNILKLYVKNYTIYIYTHNYFIFYKERGNKFKNELKKLIDTNFSSFTIIP